MSKIIDVIYQMIRAAEGPLYNTYFDPWQEIKESSCSCLQCSGNEIRPLAPGCHEE